MKIASWTRRQTGFSLIEVVIALGIAGMAATLMITVCGKLSENSGSVTDRAEASRVLDAVSLHLQRSLPDAANETVPDFSVIQEWVARPASNLQRLYSYRSNADPGQILVSRVMPAAGSVEGKLFVAQIAPPGGAFGTSANYAPLSINLFAVSMGTANPVDPACKVGAYSMVILK